MRIKFKKDKTPMVVQRASSNTNSMMCRSYTLLLPLLLLVACTNDDFLQTPDKQQHSYTVTTSITLEDTWENTTPEASAPATTRAVGDPLFMVYLFDSNDIAINNKGGYMPNISSGVKLYDINTPGTYTIYGITNLVAGEYTSTGTGITITSASTFTLDATAAPHDVALGSQSLTVTAGQNAYTTSITVNHIMSRLALTVNSVPSDVTSMTVTLPSQANVFDFIGNFTGNTTSQTLTLTRAATANANGTYTWSCEPTIVFPCATGTTSMPMTITWGPYNGTGAVNGTKVVSTTSSYCCLSTHDLSLSATWSEAFRTSATITTSDWSALEEGTFSW